MPTRLQVSFCKCTLQLVADAQKETLSVDLCKDMAPHGVFATVKRYNTLQHTATHCNTPQHTATHCNTHQKGIPWVFEHK